MCVRVLDLLKTHDRKRFITTGGHSTITPCTLPESLPADIIKAIVVEFGKRLRGDLVKIQQHAEVLRQRTSSIDTRRISLESMMQRNEEVDCDEIDQGIRRRYELEAAAAQACAQVQQATSHGGATPINVSHGTVT